MSHGTIDEDEDGRIHVMPINDIREHQSEMSCWCRPQVDVDDDEVVVHNSADMREENENPTGVLH